MASELWIAAGVQAGLVGVLLRADATGSRALVGVLKALCSACFVVTALVAGVLDAGSFGTALLVALCASWLGDVLLLGRAREWFLAGLGAFVIAHAAYSAAFVAAGLSWSWMAVAASLAVPFALGVEHRLRPWVGDDLRVPVRAYMVAVTLMLVLAAGATGAGATSLVLAGAVGFFVSDLSVALDHFVEPEARHRRWGWPAYYAAQWCFAVCVAA